MSDQFLLDSQIRLWVFLPILLLTFLIEVIRHYLILLVKDNATLTTEEIRDINVKKRVQALQENYMYISKSAFNLRKSAFKEKGGFLPDKRKPADQKKQSFTLTNQLKVLNVLKGHSSNHLPMILAGAWVSYTFSGFITTKVPFPLTFSFRPMLQRNIDLTYLDPSWVSSCSWYFLNVFGIRNLLGAFFEENSDFEVPEMNDFAGQENAVCFKGDFENLQMISYRFELKNVSEKLAKNDLD